jgi:hypothetical protein
MFDGDAVLWCSGLALFSPPPPLLSLPFPSLHLAASVQARGETRGHERPRVRASNAGGASHLGNAKSEQAGRTTRSRS